MHIKKYIQSIRKDPKKQAILGGAIVAVCVLIAGGIWALQDSPAVQSQDQIGTTSEPKEKKNKEKPKVIPRRIDGVIVAREDANNVPACVMIENAAFGGVRPQSGLSQASVVYEVIVEGGITRLMALFAGEKSDMVGPVRSARDTYLEFASEYNCAYYHAGGSTTAMTAIPRFKMRDIDGLREPQYFWRQAGKYAPHNLFSSTDKLYQAIVDHSWSKEDPPSYASWVFEDALAQDQRPAADTEEGVHSVEIGFGGSYNVEYTYNEDENYYARSNNGTAHTDAVNDQQLSTKNIVVYHVGEGISVEGKGRVNWPVTGEGDVEIFHDGQRFAGKWKKADRLARTIFIDEEGKEIPLVRGNTWVEIVPPHIEVSYQ